MTIPWADVVATVRSLVTEITAAGIRVPLGSRLPQYLKTLEAVEKRGAVDCFADFRKIVFASQESLLLDHIFDSLNKLPELVGWREKFGEILNGPYFPGDGRDQPRDFQAELYFAAEAKRLGYRVKLGNPGLGESDVFVHHDTDWLAVEAKRPRLLDDRPMRACVERAAKQITRQGVDGLMFLDFSLAVAETKKYLNPDPAAKDSPLARAAKDPAFVQIETPDKRDGYISILREFLAGISSETEPMIPPNLRSRVLGISSFAIDTMLIGPSSRLGMPLPFSTWVNLPVQYVGSRFYTEFERRLRGS